MAKDTTKVSEVVKELGLLDGSFATRRPRKHRILALMDSEEAEVLGAIYVFLAKSGISAVTPPLTRNQYHDFLERYYERCLREDPTGEWVCSRYQAGWDIVNWFMAVWNTREVPPAEIGAIKRWIEGIYLSGDEDLRLCLETATLEHLFEVAKVRKYFSDWQRKATLAAAYDRALDWSKGGGKTPLGKKEGFKKIAGEES